MIPLLSVVIPLKNEEANLPLLIEELFFHLKKIPLSFEVICVDDGSTDGTLEMLEKLKESHPELFYLSLDQNHGQTAAFALGFKKARGKYIFTLDGDGQNDPADISKLWELRDQADLIVGRRAIRKDSFLKKIISRFANRIRQKVLKDGVDDSGCSLKLFRRSALEQIKLFKGMHRFFPALFVIEGFRVIQTDVNHRQRINGKSHYNLFNRSFNTLLDLLAVKWMEKRSIRANVVKEG